MTISVEHQNQVLARVRQCYELAERAMQRPFPFPQVQFNQRGKIAGSAHLQKNLLKFNPVLLADNLAHFLQHVVPHEVSHLMVYQLYGKARPHGPEWQQIMSEVFEQVPTARHSLDITKVQGKTFSYRCGCGEIQLTVRRHNKVVRKEQQYICRKCGSTLVQSCGKRQE